LLLILSNAPSRPKRYTLSLHDALPIFKPKVAAEHGAVGCLIYSDPREDGYFGGDVFPKGAWRPRDGVQRGSVMDMPLYPGDPLTDRKSTRLNSSHQIISYAVFCLKKKI